ncbi:MAG: transcriptional regulator, partial [archaeon]
MDTVSNGLLVHGFESRCFERSCLDILAKNDKHLLALKLLHNVDSFSYEQAIDLKKVTLKMNASPMLLGCVGRNFTLKE